MSSAEPCADCLELVGGGRQTPPHAHLKLVGRTREFAGEQNYRCENCGKKWMHETGNAGYGWIQSAEH